MTVIPLHGLLEKRYPACRTNRSKAALNAHTLSVRGVGEQSIKVTDERDHNRHVFALLQRHPDDYQVARIRDVPKGWIHHYAL